MTPKPLLVITTVPTEEEASSLADKLVSARLAACVNRIGPVSSHFFWQNAVQKEQEFKLFIKTTENRWEELRAFIKANHSYTVPEITAIPVMFMDDSYLKWLVDYTG